MASSRGRRHAWLIAAVILLTTIGLPTATIAQTSLDFVYVFPKFSPASSAEMIISNLSSRLVTGDVTFYDPSGGQSAVYAEITPRGQIRATPDIFAAFGAKNFNGTVVVRMTGPVSVQVRVPLGGGLFETLEPSVGSKNLIIPFSQGTLGRSEISIFNDTSGSVNVVMIAVGANGIPIGNNQVPVAAHGTTRVQLEEAIPAVLAGSNRESRDVSHVLLRLPVNIFGPERRIFALANVTEYSNPGEGLRRRLSDIGVVQGIPETNAQLNSTLPFFVHGSNWVTLLQVINTSSVAGSATLTARGIDGAVLPGTNPATVQLPVGGSIRRSAQNLFNFPTDFFAIGSITAQSTVPAISSAAIGNNDGGAFVILPTAEPANTNFVFSVNQVNAQFFTGFSFLNTSNSEAHLTLRDMNDDGTAVSRASLTLPAQSSVVRSLAEVLPEVRTAGFIHIVSDVPIIVSALEGTGDGTFLSNLPAMHSQPDYVPPDPVRFLATGNIKHGGVTFPGVTVQLSGPVNKSVVTDETGAFVFRDIPAGTFTLRPAATGFSFNPSEITFTINANTGSSRNNDFTASLVTPTINVVQPTSVVAGGTATDIFVSGGPFNATSQIVFEGNALPSTITTAAIPVQVVSATGAISIVMQNTTGLKATLDQTQLLVPRDTFVQVQNRGPGGSILSASKPITVGSPAPVLTGLGVLPAQLLAGNPGFSTTISGSGFLLGVVVRVQGISRETVLETPTTVRVRIPPEDLAAGGILKITAINPAPTVGPSNSLDLAVLNPIPGLLAISPNQAEVRLEANAPDLAMTVTGFNFKQGAKILVGATEIPTTFASSSSLTGLIPPSALQIGGAVQVTVKNPDPSLGRSEALPLFLTNLPPILSSIDAGVLFFDPSRPTETFNAPVIFNGSNFGPNSIFEVQSPCAGAAEFGALTATLANSHQGVLSVPIQCAGAYQVRVRTPQPGGGISAVRSFTVVSLGQRRTPTISSLSPPLVAAGSGMFDLTITGTNFEGGAVVSFGNSVLFPSRVTATTVTVTVPGFLITQPGVIPVVVTNPSGTGSSNRVLFSVN